MQHSLLHCKHGKDVASGSLNEGLGATEAECVKHLKWSFLQK